MRGARVVAAVVAASATLMGAAVARATPAPVRTWPAQTGPARRIGRALGIVRLREVTGTPRVPVVYHGGTVMHGVRVHAVFWAPAGYGFAGSPQPGVPGYAAVLQTFLDDVASASGRQDNVFATLAQYGDGRGAGSYAMSFSAGRDTVTDTSPYPPLAQQCTSPSGFTTCLTDAQIGAELARVVETHGRAAGLHDLWFVYLPPGVDECVSDGQCGTTAFAGYHSVFATANGPVVYAVVIDPMIEAVIPPGSDPQGNPDAEAAADVTAHEAVEAITDPEGTGWMDPGGGEVGDKCATAVDAPRGYASNGSPFNQVIGGRAYLLQAMWSNSAAGCVEAAAPAAAPYLPTLALEQYSAVVRGTSGQPGRRLAVTVGLVRGGEVVAIARTVTGMRGGWRVRLGALSSDAPIGVGDDRDVVLVRYGPGGPPPETIATGAGGDPFVEAGFTGWYALDHGFAIRRRSVLLSPCGQTGVLTLFAGRPIAASPMDLCSAASDVAVVPTGPLSAGTRLHLTSSDNRASTPDDPAGALVSLGVAPGEPGSVADPATAPDPTLGDPGGLPSCVAELAMGRARCTGLTPGGVYELTRRRGRGRMTRAVRAASDGSATLSLAGGIRGGDRLTLARRGGRTLTTLHVAHLRVDLAGRAGTVRAGACEPGQYWGQPLAAPPAGPGDSVAGTGTVCPPDGAAAGLPAGALEQTDSLSGGATRTEVPTLAGLSPAAGATLYGGFIAVARVAGPSAGSATAGLLVTPRGRRGTARRVAGAGAVQGARVAALAPGVYDAVWTVRDANGDTRTVRSWFVEEG